MYSIQVNRVVILKLELLKMSYSIIRAPKFLHAMSQTWFRNTWHLLARTRRLALYGWYVHSLETFVSGSMKTLRQNMHAPVALFIVKLFCSYINLVLLLQSFLRNTAWLFKFILIRVTNEISNKVSCESVNFVP